MRRAVLALFLGCNGNPAETSGLTAPGTSVPMTSSGEMSSSSSSSSSSTSGSSSTGESAGGSGSTGTLWDMGPVPDFDAKPPGCQGKIDFLFIISRDGHMKPHQDKLVAAFPHFIEKIESAFADFDVHILVTDSHEDWGSAYCTGDCPGVCAADPDYPCDYTPSYCDQAMGAGIVMNVGPYTEDRMCLTGPQRYITADTPDRAGTFTCLARVGASGFNMIGNALVAAMSPQLNQFGACNEGFIRDDALLMVTLIGQEEPSNGTSDSEGTWQEWRQAVVDKKKGNLDAIVMFGLISGDPECLAGTVPFLRLCHLVPSFPHHVFDLLTIPDYGPAFDEAAEKALEACSLFVPG